MKILLLCALLCSVSPLIAVKASEYSPSDPNKVLSLNNEQVRKRMREFCYNERQKGRSTEDLYQIGLAYRDGKVGSYAQESWFAQEWAKAYFYKAASLYHLKAMHNLGSIFYKVIPSHLESRTVSHY